MTIDCHGHYTTEPKALPAFRHDIGDAAMSLEWSQVCNELIHRVTTLFPVRRVFPRLAS